MTDIRNALLDVLREKPQITGIGALADELAAAVKAVAPANSARKECPFFCDKRVHAAPAVLTYCSWDGRGYGGANPIYGIDWSAMKTDFAPFVGITGVDFNLLVAEILRLFGPPSSVELLRGRHTTDDIGQPPSSQPYAYITNDPDWVEVVSYGDRWDTPEAFHSYCRFRGWEPLYRLHTPSPQPNLRVTGFRGNPLRVVLSSGGDATISQKLIDSFASPSPFEQHPDDVAVDRFAVAMKAKLAEKRADGAGGWDDPEVCHIDYLAHLLAEQIHSRAALDPVDIGNFAMMIFNRGETPSHGR